MTAPLAYPPMLIIGLSSYQGRFMLSIGFCSYGVDEKDIDRLFDHYGLQTSVIAPPFLFSRLEHYILKPSLNGHSYRKPLGRLFILNPGNLLPFDVS